ncbi:hypothetical protein C1Y40_05155 [Mycobacterium talmoniae]|uniref:Uncharacterized protein n=1 Tax=Mycobacterium talmoniae TaxID=1858794 RepID=A0A2S8BDF9_9MYCO|nr:hypothetical protein C1Y40_05155 [Mycobacterium talmoniae]
MSSGSVAVACNHDTQLCPASANSVISSWLSSGVSGSARANAARYTGFSCGPAARTTSTSSAYSFSEARHAN